MTQETRERRRVQSCGKARVFREQKYPGKGAVGGGWHVFEVFWKGSWYPQRQEALVFRMDVGHSPPVAVPTPAAPLHQSSW